MRHWLGTMVLLVACTEAKAAVVVEQPKAAPVAVSRVPLGERLASEASSRPERAVRPAQLLTALEKQNVAFSKKRQVLASPIDASYCELGLTSTGLALSICEFSDADAAERGLARSRTTFDAMFPGRTLDTRFNALLTVTQPTTPEAERQRELARRTFAALQPRMR